jgi:NDP-sugar pyrophosphorylase family protein
VEHSVVLENCSIRNIERLSDCVIGRCAVVTRRGDGFKATTLFIGDDAKVEL